VHTAVVVLTILGGVLPLTAIAWGAVSAHTRRSTANRQRARIQQLMDEDDQAATQRHERPDISAILEAEGITRLSTYADRAASAQITQVAIIDNALADLRGPVLLGALGIICATIGSTLSLTL
jgi:hypothetical protein